MNSLILKIKLFSFLIFVGISSSLQAQIIYTDVIPDTVLNVTLETYYIDLDQDGTNDFYLKFTSVPFHSGTGMGACYRLTNTCTAYSLNSNAIATDSGSAAVFQSADTIGTLVNWNDTSISHGYNKLESSVYQRFCTSSHNITTTYSGNWLNQNDKYLGLKLVKNGSTYFGWARLRVISASSITVKDFAYNPVPNQFIGAGDGVTFAATYFTGTGCAGDTISVPYEVHGTFNSNNVFTAELSNSTGSFASPLTIGSINSTTTGIILGTVPSSITGGSAYRIRIQSSSPATSPSDNGTNLTFRTALVATLVTTTANPGCGHVTLGIDAQTGNSYEWKLDTTTIATSSSPGITLSKSGQYTCTITNTCGTTISNAVDVIIYRVPAVSILPSTPVELCPGSNAHLIAKARLGLNYQWYSGSVMIPNAENTSFIATISGSYYVRVTNIHGCAASSYITNVSIRNPDASIYNDGASSFCVGDSTMLLTDYNSNYTYQWLKNGQVIPGATTQEYWVSTAGNYQVNVSNGSCDSTSAIVQIHVNCRQRDGSNSALPGYNSELTIAPNPFSDFTTISFSLDQPQKITLEIYDLTGRLIKTIIDEELSEGLHQYNWNAKNEYGKEVSSGIYFVKLIHRNYNQQSVDYPVTQRLYISR